MKVKLRAMALGAHVRVHVFVGKPEMTLALAGTLMLAREEWARFRAALETGSYDPGSVFDVEVEEDALRLALGRDEAGDGGAHVSGAQGASEGATAPGGDG